MINVIFLICIYIIVLSYLLFFKERTELNGNYATLVKVLEFRDLTLMRILPEIKSRKTKNEITNLVQNRMVSKKTGINSLIFADVELNKKLNPIYIEFNNSKNPLVRAELRKIVSFEKKLKVIRREFNKSADEYNQNLIDHSFVCGKILRMKPVDKYKLGF